MNLSASSALSDSTALIGHAAPFSNHTRNTKQNPDGYRGQSNFGIHMPNVVNEFCAKVVGNMMLAHQRESESIYLAFYDAAWQLDAPYPERR